MAIKVASWNVEGRLHGYQKSGRGTVAHILAGITRLDADIIVLPEFYMDSLAEGVKSQLNELGYEIFEAIYNDAERGDHELERWGHERIGILSRLPISDVQEIRPAGLRNLLMCHVTDPENGYKLRVIAIHLEDRAEAMRVKQAEALVKTLNEETLPTVLLGDFNAMWHRGRAILLTSQIVRLLAKNLPHKELRSMGIRMTEMAKGETLRLLASHANLRDADPRSQSTATPKARFTSFMPSIRLLQIDHMLVSPDVVVKDFVIHKDGGSDHRAISAVLQIKNTKK